MVFSCKKDTIEQQQTQEDEQMMRSKKVIALIHNFEQKMNDALKSAETISLDSAVWCIEASLNYNYADPANATGEYSINSFTYTFSVNENSEVLLSDVQTIYEQMENDLVNNQKSSDNVVLAFSDISVDSLVGGTAYMSGTNGSSSGLPRSYIAIDDDWYWGTLGGPLVGNCLGTDSTSDASNELEWRLNNPLPAPTEQIFYTDLETPEIFGEDFLDENDYPRLYIGWNYPYDDCLTIDTLTYYLNQSDDIIYTYKPNGGLRPTTKDFVKVIIDDALLFSQNYSAHYHLYKVTYGIPTVAPPPN